VGFTVFPFFSLLLTLHPLALREDTMSPAKLFLPSFLFLPIVPSYRSSSCVPSETSQLEEVIEEARRRRELPSFGPISAFPFFFSFFFHLFLRVKEHGNEQKTAAKSEGVMAFPSFFFFPPFFLFFFPDASFMMQCCAGGRAVNRRGAFLEQLFPTFSSSFSFFFFHSPATPSLACSCLRVR